MPHLLPIHHTYPCSSYFLSPKLFFDLKNPKNPRNSQFWPFLIFFFLAHSWYRLHGMPKYYHPLKWTWVTVPPHFTVEHPKYWPGQFDKTFYTQKCCSLLFLSFEPAYPQKNPKNQYHFLVSIEGLRKTGIDHLETLGFWKMLFLADLAFIAVSFLYWQSVLFPASSKCSSSSLFFFLS